MTKETFSLLSSRFYIAIILSIEVTAFQSLSFQHHSSVYHSLDCTSHCVPVSGLYSKLFGPDEGIYDDGIGDLSNGMFDKSGTDTGPSSYGGDGLARDFYKQLRQREAETAGSSTILDGKDTTASIDRAGRGINDDGPNYSSPAQSTKASSSTTATPSVSTLPEDEARYLNQQPFSKRKEMSVASSSRSNGLPSQGGVTKYTGRSESGLGRPSTNDNSGRSPRQAMMAREFELAGRGSGGSLALQAAVIAMAFIFYIYIGLTGGIVTGEEAATADFGGDDMIPFEQVVPRPRDSEPSVWI